MGTLVAAVLGAYLCARIVNTVAASAIAPKPTLLQQSVGAAPQVAQMPARTELDVDALPQAVQNASRAGPRPAIPAALEGRTLTIPLGTPMDEIELRVIRETLRHTKGDKNLAAQILGIASRTIYRKLPKDS